MRSLSGLLILGLLGGFAYLLVNGYQADDVLETMTNATEQAQDFVNDVDIEGETNFESIEPVEVTVPPARQVSGSFGYQGPSSALAFGISPEE